MQSNTQTSEMATASIPNFFVDKVFGVFLAEPMSDIIAATVTASAFFG